MEGDPGRTSFRVGEGDGSSEHLSDKVERVKVEPTSSHQCDPMHGIMAT